MKLSKKKTVNHKINKLKNNVSELTVENSWLWKVLITSRIEKENLEKHVHELDKAIARSFEIIAENNAWVKRMKTKI